MDSTLCKKCGEQHRIDSYREVRYYVCPVVNRVLLLTDGEDDANKKADTNWTSTADPR